MIASPSRLIDTIGSDQINTVKNIFRAEPKAFPKHPCAPDDLAGIKLANLSLHTKHRQQGDHVAMLRFHAIPGGIEFSVDYVCTDPDEQKRRRYSATLGPFKLLSV